MVQANEDAFVILRKPFQLPALERRCAKSSNAARTSMDAVVPFPHGRGAPGS